MNKPWTNHEIKRLHECFPAMSYAEMLVEFAPRTKYALIVQATRLGIRRPRRKKIIIRKPRRDWLSICAQHAPLVFCGRAT